MIQSKEGIPLFEIPVAAGFPSPAADYLQKRIDLNELLIKHPSATFFVKVEGDSMINAFIPPKALLLVDKALNPQNGDVIVAFLNGEFTVKTFSKDESGVMLTPANPAYSPIKITEEMDCRIWGVVSQIFIDPRECKHVRLS